MMISRKNIIPTSNKESDAKDVLTLIANPDEEFEGENHVHIFESKDAYEDLHTPQEIPLIQTIKIKEKIKGARS